MTRLVLFDIDGTLIETNTVANEAFPIMFRRVFDSEVADVDAREGETYKAILYDTLLAKGFTKNYIDSHYRKATRVMNELAIRNTKKEGSVSAMPHIKELLEGIVKAGAVLALCTGNPEEVAWAKLEAAGLKDYFKFGSFGDREFKRWKLVQNAQFKAEGLTKKRFTGKDIVIIGDTPHDIVAGQPFSANTIAIATGRHSVGELKKENPTHLFKDFSDTKAVLSAILED